MVSVCCLFVGASGVLGIVWPSREGMFAGRADACVNNLIEL